MLVKCALKYLLAGWKVVYFLTSHLDAFELTHIIDAEDPNNDQSVV